MIFVTTIPFFANSLPAQTPREDLIAEVKKADSLYYQAHDYRQAAIIYSRVHYKYPNLIRWTDEKNTADYWARAGEPDSALYYLGLAAASPNNQWYGNMLLDEDQAALRSDPRWQKAAAMVDNNRFKAHPGLDRQLVHRLDTINYNDQFYRQQLEEVQTKYGWDSKELKQLRDTINQHDSLDLLYVKDLLDHQGWPAPEVASEDGASTVFLVIQHADLATQQHYLPMMREAVAWGKARGKELAMLEDRVAIRTGKRQIYGTQIGTIPSSHRYYVAPLDDPDHVDERRAKVGLQPLAAYVKQWQINWDMEQYKKDLPVLELIEKTKK